MDVENFGVRPVGQEPVADRMHQVGLAQPDPAVDEKRVVKMARHAGDVHRRRACHPVGGAFDQRIESQAGVQPVLEGGAAQVFARAGHVARHIGLGDDGHRYRPGNDFTRSKR
jgi:hypothetical protein